MDTFRLIESGFCDAATNMAVDEALFLAYQEHLSLPVLRLYGWQPPALSIGFSQHADRVLNLEKLAAAGIAFVRRSTGGGTLYHDDELSYAVIASTEDVGSTFGVKDAFEKVTRFLLETYRRLDLKADFAKNRQSFVLRHDMSDFCLAKHEAYDVVIKGAKIGGNAERRHKNIILQHGAVPFSLDKKRCASFLKNPGVVESCKITTLNEFTGGKIKYHHLAELLASAFASTFRAKVRRDVLSPKEEKIAAELIKDKYNNMDWNLFRQVPDHRHPVRPHDHPQKPSMA